MTLPPDREPSDPLPEGKRPPLPIPGRSVGWDGRIPGGNGVRRALNQGPRKLEFSLGKIANRMGVDGGARTLSLLFSHWEEMVGTAVAAHSEPIRLRGKVLTVAVDHPTWATQLRFLSASMLSRLGELVGGEEVSTLEITVRRKSPK